MGHIEKLTILKVVDGFKLHNMMADTKNSCRIGRFVWITCGWIFFARHHIVQFEKSTPIGGFVKTMLKLCCAHLISLYCRQAQMDRDGASNYKRVFFLHRFRILKGIKIASLVQKLGPICWIWLNGWFHIQYKITNFHY